MNEMTSIRDWVSAQFSRAELFERLGIDFCCGGHRSLKEACEEKKLSVNEVIKQLESWTRDHKALDYSQMSPTDLCNHIESVHHSYMKRMIPLIRSHLIKIVNAHGNQYSLLQETFELFAKEIEKHMEEEEKVAFPLFRSEKGVKETLLSELEKEHDEAGDLLSKMRHLTHEYNPGSAACMTLQTTWAELQEMEKDMHLHVFIENHILFPKVLANTQNIH